MVQFAPEPARAGTAERIRHLDADYVVYWVDSASDELELFWQDDDGQAFGSFARLRKRLASRKRELKFAINSGIYSAGGAPLGLHVERSKVLRELNLGGLEGGQWNFYLKPNGVFYVAGRTAAILESGRFAKLDLRPVLACQSGPLLLEDGQVHPSFRPKSTNFHVRSGVGVTRDSKIVFAISEKTVRFYDFALLFKERLGCDNALYLDGQICAIYLPELGYKAEETGTRFAGLFGVTAKERTGPGSP
jgi:uncharacterized protein YigE (DUF2233 family)